MATVVISALALVVSLCTAFGTTAYTQKVTMRREIAAWERSELLRSTSELAQLSLGRQANLSQAYDTMINLGSRSADPFDVETEGVPHPLHSVTLMTVLVERIALINVELSEAARSVVELHQNAVSESIYEFNGDFAAQVDALMVNHEELLQRHRALTTAFHKAVKRERPVRSDAMPLR